MAGFDVPPPGGAIPGFGLPPGMPGAEAAAAAVPAAAASPVATGFSTGFSNGPAPPMIGMQIPGALPSPSLKALNLLQHCSFHIDTTMLLRDGQECHLRTLQTSVWGRPAMPSCHLEVCGTAGRVHIAGLQGVQRSFR